MSFSVQADAAPALGIDYPTTLALVTRAFERWSAADCGGQPPSIAVRSTPRPASCDRPEHNRDHANANVWMFANDGWSYASNALAVTTVTFDADDGAILDTDVELNAAEMELTLGDAGVRYDLESIVQHESGHFLGISHSDVREATMYQRILKGTTDKRELHADDLDAVCAAYPPERTRRACDFRPENGWSARCAPDAGCSAVRAPLDSGAAALAAAWLLALAIARTRGR